MSPKPVVDLIKTSPLEFNQEYVGEGMIYMRKRHRESTPLKRKALYLHEGGWVLLKQLLFLPQISRASLTILRKVLVSAGA